jgi:hypothetical protein
MNKAKELSKMIEHNFQLYDEPGSEEANKAIAKELDRLAATTGKQIEIILNRYKKLGASDSESRDEAFKYFKKLIDPYRLMGL